MWILFELVLSLIYWACLGLAAHSLADTQSFRLTTGARVHADTGLPIRNLVIFVLAMMIVLFLSFLFGIRLYSVIRVILG